MTIHDFIAGEKERLVKTVNTEWKEPQFSFEAMDNLIGFTKHLIGTFETFNRESHAKNLERLIGEVDEVGKSCTSCKGIGTMYYYVCHNGGDCSEEDCYVPMICPHVTALTAVKELLSKELSELK